MKILVTGSKGTLGSALVKELSKRNYEVWGCDLQHQRDDNYIRADIKSYRQLERVFEQDYDFVYHLAAEFGRINGEEYTKEGDTLLHSACLGRHLAGPAVDFISVSTGEQLCNVREGSNDRRSKSQLCGPHQYCRKGS